MLIIVIESARRSSQHLLLTIATLPFVSRDSTRTAGCSDILIYEIKAKLQTAARGVEIQIN